MPDNLTADAEVGDEDRDMDIAVIQLSKLLSLNLNYKAFTISLCLRFLQTFLKLCIFDTVNTIEKSSNSISFVFLGQLKTLSKQETWEDF